MADPLLIGNREEVVGALHDYFKKRNVADVEASITRLEGDPEVEVRVWLEKEDSFLLDEVVCQTHYDAILGRYVSNSSFSGFFRFLDSFWSKTLDDCEAVIEAAHLARPSESVVTKKFPGLNVQVLARTFFNEVEKKFFMLFEKTGTDGRSFISRNEFDRLKQAQHEADFEKYGLLDPIFFEKVNEKFSASPDEKIPAVLFTSYDLSKLPPRPDPDVLRRLSGKQLEDYLKQYRESVKKEVARIQGPVLSHLRALDITELNASESIPVIYTAMTPQQILDLSKKRDLFLHIEDGQKAPLVNLGEDCSNLSGNEQDSTHCAIGLPGVHDFSDPYPARAEVIDLEGLVDELEQCGMKEGGLLNYSNSSTKADHPTQVAAVISSDYGVFPNVRIDSFDLDETVKFQSHDGGFENALKWGLDNGVYVFNASIGVEITHGLDGESYAMDKIIDSLIYTYGPTLAVASGNVGQTCDADKPYVSSPATAYNVIAVGNFKRGPDNGCDISNDTVSSTSCYKDPDPVGRQKPEVLAQGTCIRVPIYPQSSSDTCEWGLTSGTSLASPQVAGEALILAGVDPSLLSWTEGVKALTMATAFNTANQGYGLTDKGGGGGIRVDNAYESVEAGRWKKISLAGDSDYDFVTWYKNITLPVGTERAKFVIAWSIADSDWLDDNDLLVTNLSLYSGDQLIAQSSNPYNANNFILLDVDLTDTYHTNYTLYASLLVGDEALENAPMAFAWGVDPVCLEKGRNWDNDNYCGDEDNCPWDANDQTDVDKDGLGDACDSCDDRFDQDKDTVADDCDNCPEDKNKDQSNIDGDSMGDVCDPDIDGDGCLNEADQDPDNDMEISGSYIAPFCPKPSGSTYAFAGGSDGRGLPLRCATDDNDGDGIKDVDDICPDVPVKSQRPGATNSWLECHHIYSCPLTPIEIFDPHIVENPGDWSEIEFWNSMNQLLWLNTIFGFTEEMVGDLPVTSGEVSVEIGG